MIYPNIASGVVAVSLLFSNIPALLKILAIVWKLSLLFMVKYYTQKRGVNLKIFIIPFLLGLFLFFAVINYL